MFYQVFYHNDVDGAMSAALFVLSNPGCKFNLQPVRSADRQVYTKLTKKIKGATVVAIDIDRAPGVDLWFDHHKSNSVPVEGDLFNVDARSCFQILASYALVKGRVISEDLIRAIGDVDTATYKSPSEPFESRDPINILRIWVAQNAGVNKHFMNAIVGSLVINDLDVEKVVSGVDIDKIINHDIDASKSAMNDITIINGVGVIFQHDKAPIARYAEFYIYRNMRYCIRYTYGKGNSLSVRLSVSPWIESKVDAVDVLRSVIGEKGVGGHKGIAGGKIDEADEFEVTSAIIMNLERIDGEVCD